MANEITIADQNATNLFKVNTLKPETFEEKAMFYNAIQNAEGLDDMINEVIELQDIIIQDCHTVDDEGVQNDNDLIYLIDSEGKSYATRSRGVAVALSNILMTFGMPSTWGRTLPVKVVKQQGQQYKFTTLVVEL